MTWQPGTPVVTPEDVADWQASKRESKRESLRWIRAHYQRIDYYPDKAAGEAIRRLVDGGAGYTGAINRLVVLGFEALQGEEAEEAPE